MKLNTFPRKAHAPTHRRELAAWVFPTERTAMSAIEDGFISATCKRLSGTLFPLGRTMMTPGARDSVPPEVMTACMYRHSTGDWGDLDEHDRTANQAALRDGDRILSVYNVPGTDIRFYILTEWDRSLTTVLLPSEY